MAFIPVQLEVDGPITALDESELVKRTITVDDETEHSVATEYRLKTAPRAERAIHRSADVVLKEGLHAEGVALSFG